MTVSVNIVIVRETVTSQGTAWNRLMAAPLEHSLTKATKIYSNMLRYKIVLRYTRTR